MQNAIALVPLAGLFLGIISTIGGFFLYYTSTIRKRYAAERDFQHLKGNQQAIIELLKLLESDIEDLKLELVRIAESLRKA